MSVALPPVLVVDDEKNMRLSLKTLLADEGYAVRAVESAEGALNLLEREEFFMVITDARLGGMSGYEFLAKARGQWPELPVLMLTAYATSRLAVDGTLVVGCAPATISSSSWTVGAGGGTSPSVTVTAGATKG